MPLIDALTMSGMSDAQVHSSKPSIPIDICPTTLAGLANHLHPVLLLTGLWFCFPALVANPVSELSWSLLLLAITQILHCVICLPHAGTTSRTAKRIHKIKGSPTKKSNDGLLPLTKIPHVIISLFLSIPSIPFLLTLQILLGAPLTTHLTQTFLSSAHLALLAIFPLIYVHGIEGSKWLEILSAQRPFDAVFGAAVGAAVGAWLGAVPIPLDWDREWQKWPVTIVTGMYMGYVTGKMLGGWVVKGKRIKFD